MYFITVFGQRVFSHEDKSVWKEKSDQLLNSSWRGYIGFGFEPK